MNDAVPDLVAISLADMNFGPLLEPLCFSNVVGYQLPGFEELTVFARRQDEYIVPVHRIAPDEEDILIAIDTSSHDAFAHWFFESLVWLPRIRALARQFPKLKVHLFERKRYKTDVLDYLGIEWCDTLPPRNKVFFLPRTTSLNSNRKSKAFEESLEELRLAFPRQPAAGHKDKVLLLPRQKVENFKGNERDVDSTDIESYVAARADGRVFHVYDSAGFGSQVDAVLAARTMIVPDGSAFLVNGFLAKGTTIVVLGRTHVPNQIKLYEKYRLIFDYIVKNNDVVFIKGDGEAYRTSQIDGFVSGTFTFALTGQPEAFFYS